VGGVLLYLTDIPLSISLTLLGATVYLTLTFYFNCCIFHVGARRELLWVQLFVALCLISLLLTGWLKILWILPLGAAATVYFCWDAHRDGYTHYRKGLRHMDRGDSPGMAVEALQRACELTPDDMRFTYHLGRALAGANLVKEGQAKIADALENAPDLLESLRNDPLFQPHWLLEDEKG
jgi:hypothetical protein